MRRLIFILLLCAAEVQMNAESKDSLLVMFWNVENFFDWIDQGTGDSDKSFSSLGERHWTKKRFYAKCDDIAKSILWIGDRYGRMPDIIGLSEVENKGVLIKLLNSTLLRKFDYRIIHRDSRDRRGIDVAVLYRSSKMNPLTQSFLSLDSLRTRDILQAEMLLEDGKKLDIIVNHHPSKFGGLSQSDINRERVMSRLKDLCDSLLSSGHTRLLAMGDFNDTPDAKQFDILGGVLENKGTDLHKDGRGTIRYKGKWELIDMFLTYGLGNCQMDILELPFLMIYDNTYPGYKPLRTYSGPRYIGGVSDHCPICLWAN